MDMKALAVMLLQHADLSEPQMTRTVEQFAAACGSSSGPGSTDNAGGGRSPAAANGPHLEQQAAPPPPPPPPASGARGGEQSPEPSLAPTLIEVLATTDASLKALSKDLLPLAPTLLVNYDLPPRKEVYQRRISAVVGSRSRPGGRCRAAGGGGRASWPACLPAGLAVFDVAALGCFPLGQEGG